MRLISLFIIIFFSLEVSSSSFSEEIFGKEGANGIANPKTRSLSFAFQYLTVTGSIGYVVKKLYDGAFFEPFGILPDKMIEGSPLAYGSYNPIDSHSSKIIGVNQNLDYLNYNRDLRENYLNNRFSNTSIEIRNKSNLIKSQENNIVRNNLIDRYFND